MRRIGVGEDCSPISILFGPGEQVVIGRGLTEFRAGRPLIIVASQGPLLALPVEGLDARRLTAFTELSASKRPRLVLSARRACAIGQGVAQPIALDLPSEVDARIILTLVEDVDVINHLGWAPAGDAEKAGIKLMKLAQLLPAVLVADVPAERMHGLSPLTVKIEASAVVGFQKALAQSLSIASEAFVPLEAGDRARFVVFRDSLGDTSTAVIVGSPDLSRPVPVRIHSACLTGDVFGSRRCDCGDQLNLALARLHEVGGGIILYLAQEGRGLGLANKMRAYTLQDAGLDTVDANTTLGFDDDERDYGIASRMLRMLGCAKVLLLTNNPAKLDGLARTGIAIAGRMPLEAPVNAHNHRYMAAKAERAGHQLEHLPRARPVSSSGLS
jgi:GTP cyclohydrolase II